MIAHFLSPEYIRITAQYSNAVLVAILPHIADYSQKLHIEAPLAITTNNVVKFQCSSDANDPGGTVTLTNGDTFTFAGGAVIGFCDKRHSFGENNVRGRFYKFAGPIKMSKEEAIAFARKKVEELGYPVADLFADGDPSSIALPWKFGTNDIPFYSFAWKDPRGEVSYEVEIDAFRKRLTAMTFFPSLWPGPLKVDVSHNSLRLGEAPAFAKGLPGLETEYNRDAIVERHKSQVKVLRTELLGFSEFAKAIHCHPTGI